MKIAVQVPVLGETVARRFSVSLSRALVQTASANITVRGKRVQPEIFLSVRPSSHLLNNRTALLEEAIGQGSDYFVFLDSDHTFPGDTILRLIGHDLPVVVTNYPRRGFPPTPTASRLERGELVTVHTTEAKAKAGEMEEIAHSGLGVCMVRSDALEAVVRKNGSLWPMFGQDLLADGKTYGGEDAFFFRRLREAGVRVMLDHRLSWEIRHLHEIELSHADIEPPVT